MSVAAGIWHLRRSGRRATVTVEAFTPPGRARRAAQEDQAARVGEILNAAAEPVPGEVEAGPHV